MVTGALPAQGGRIRIKGSEAFLILAQKWAEAYMSKHPETAIRVMGGGIESGVAALQNHTADICDASRKLKAPEFSSCIHAFGKRPREYRVALEGLSLYVHEDNPLKEISILQLKQIFTGKLKNWKEMGGNDAPITIYNRDNRSGAYEFFKELILKGADFDPTAQTMPGTAALLQAVSRDVNGIAYAGMVNARGIRALLIREGKDSPAVEPTEENILSGQYPIRRYLYTYVNPALDKGEIGAYLDWIRSDEGQGIVKGAGYFPMPKNLRESRK